MCKNRTLTPHFRVFRFSGFQRFSIWPSLIVLAWLWFQLLRQLHIEWTVNPQYAYGWAVPLLCGVLAWRQPPRTPAAASPRHNFPLPAPLHFLLLALAALAYLPTRLMQEANPDWRLVSWALAVEVVVLTLGLSPYLLACRATFCKQKPAANFAPRDLIFPISFFLVAVPWPTLLEAPLIQTLTRFNASGTIEILNAIGIPALQRGSVIEVSTGLVGIDEACSGIRSFQATLMISLFLGAWYRMNQSRRVGLVLIGFGLAMFFNLARTLLLVTVAARQGVPAIAQWHDPAGVIILLGCFGGLWLAARQLEPAGAAGLNAAPREGCEPMVGQACPLVGAPDLPFHRRLGPLVLWSFVIVILASELACAAWYRRREQQLPAAVAWRPDVSRLGRMTNALPIAERTRSILRYDHAENLGWEQLDGTRWQMIFLQWNAGRVAVHLARNHTPEVCLSAAGHELLTQSPVQELTVTPNLVLPYRHYQFRGAPPLHVFYILREDRPWEREFATAGLTLERRWAAVRAGRRNLGQRSLEVAVWGCSDAGTAEAAFRQLIQQTVVVE